MMYPRNNRGQMEAFKFQKLQLRRGGGHSYCNNLQGQSGSQKILTQRVLSIIKKIVSLEAK